MKTRPGISAAESILLGAVVLLLGRRRIPVGPARNPVRQRTRQRTGGKIDIEACAGCIRRIMEDDALRSSMASRIVAQARDRFHPDAVAAQTAEVYDRL